MGSIYFFRPLKTYSRKNWRPWPDIAYFFCIWPPPQPPTHTHEDRLRGTSSLLSSEYPELGLQLQRERDFHLVRGSECMELFFHCPIRLQFIFFFFFRWRYSPLWGLACRTIILHFSLSITNSLHLLSPST